MIHNIQEEPEGFRGSSLNWTGIGKSGGKQKHNQSIGNRFDEISPQSHKEISNRNNTSDTNIKGRKIAQPVLRVVTDVMIQNNAVPNKTIKHALNFSMDSNLNHKPFSYKPKSKQAGNSVRKNYQQQKPKKRQVLKASEDHSKKKIHNKTDPRILSPSKKDDLSSSKRNPLQKTIRAQFQKQKVKPPRNQRPLKDSWIKSPIGQDSETKTVSFGATQQFDQNDKENLNINSTSPPTKQINFYHQGLDLSVSSVSGYSEQRSAFKQGIHQNQECFNDRNSIETNNIASPLYEEKLREEHIRSGTEMDMFNMLKGVAERSHKLDQFPSKSTKEFQETGKFINPLDVEIGLNNTAGMIGSEYPHTLQVDIQNDTPKRGQTQKLHKSKERCSSITGQNSTTGGMKRKIKRSSQSLYISNKNPIWKTQKLDKLIKDNIKKEIEKKELQEYDKILLEEDKIIKRRELENRNNQVRIYNAQKVQQRKKGRSVSCMNKFAPTSPINLRYSLHTSHNQSGKPNMTIESSLLNNSNKFQTNYNKSMEQYRKMKYEEKQARRKSFVLEFKEIKKEIEMELKKEKQDKKNEKTNSNTIESLRRKESPLKPKKLNLSKKISNNDSLSLSSKKISFKRIKPLYDQNMIEEGPKVKQRLSTNFKKDNIRKYMVEQKRKIQVKKNLEKSSEMDKQKKIKGNLRNLHSYIKTQIPKPGSRRSPERIQSRFSSRVYNKRAESAKLSGKTQRIKRSLNSGSAQIDNPQQLFNLLSKPDNSQVYSQILHQGSPDISEKANIYHDTSEEDNNLTELSTEFYVEYFKILNKLQNGGPYNEMERQLLKRSGFFKDASMIYGDKKRKKRRKGKKKKELALKEFRKTSFSEPVSTKQIDCKSKQLFNDFNTINEDDNIDRELKQLMRFHAAVLIIQQRYRRHLFNKGFYQFQHEQPLHEHYLDYQEESEEEEQVEYEVIKGSTTAKILAAAIGNVSEEEKVVHMSIINSSASDDDSQRRGKVIISKDASKVSSYRSKDQYSIRTIDSAIKAEDEFQLDENAFYNNLEEQKHQNIQSIINAQSQTPGAQRSDRSESKVFEYKQPATDRKKQIPTNPESLIEESKMQRVPQLNLSALNSEEGTIRSQRQSERSSVFERNSFQEFANKKVKELDFMNMLVMREEALEQRATKDKTKISTLVQSNQMSPRTASIRTLELEKWVTEEKEEIQKTKVAFEEQWKKTKVMIEQLQKNQDFVKKMLGDTSVRSNLGGSRGGSAPGTHRDVAPVIQLISEKPTQRDDEKELEQVLKRREELSPYQESSKRDSQENVSSTDARNLKSQSEFSEDDILRKRTFSDDPHLQTQQKLSRPIEYEEILESRNDDGTPHEQIPFVITEESVKISSVETPKDIKDQIDSPIGKQTHKSFNREEDKYDLSERSSLEGKILECKDEDEFQTKPLMRTRSDHNYSLEIQKAGIESPSLYQENFFTHDFDGEKKIADVVEELKQSSHPQDIAEIIKEINEEGFLDDDDDLGEFVAEDDRFNEKNKTFNTTGQVSNFIKIEGEDDQKGSDEDEFEKRQLTDPRQTTDEEIKSQGAPDIDWQEDILDNKRSRMKHNKISIENNNLISISGENVDDFYVEDVVRSNIITGSQSLESTLSEEEKKEEVTSGEFQIEQKKTFDKESVADWITDQIMESLSISCLSNIKPRATIQSIFNMIPSDMGIDSSEESCELSAIIDKEFMTMQEKEDIPQQIEISQSPGNRLPLFILYENDGIRTDLIAIANFVEESYARVKVDKYREEFLNQLLTPVRKDPIEMLNQLQNSEIGSYEHFEAENMVNFQFPVIPLQTYLELEKARKQEREKDGEPPEEKIEDLKRTDIETNFQDRRVGRRKFKHSKKNINESEHIHNKALFDCINETLCQFRPYSKEGEPMPWSRKQRKLKTNRIKTDEIDMDRIFELVKHDLFQWAIMQAGTLPRKEFIFGGVFDDELFAEIREKKLATLLATEVLENEPQWLNYEFEEAQVKIDLGDMILEHLVTEVIYLFNAIDERRTSGDLNYQSVFRDQPGNLLPPMITYPERSGMFDTEESYDVISSVDGGDRRF